MDVTGKCLCGAVTYRATIDPAKVIICHCTDCQNHSATAYGFVAGVINNSFTLLTGNLKTYIKTADSGRKRHLTFCPECGTRLYSCTPDDDTAFFGLRAGTINERAQITPVMQAWCNSALPWVQDISGIEKVS